jgi:hypothetical protein
MKLQQIFMADGLIYACNFNGRQYNASGTGVVDIYGAMATATGTAGTFEKLMTLTVSTSAVSQISADRYPWIKPVITAGAPVFSVTGFGE